MLKWVTKAANCVSGKRSPAERHTKAVWISVTISPVTARSTKGRGLIQLTGRANYTEYGRAVGREQEILDKPELIETDPDLCVDVAGWFWAKRNLNALADADDLTAVTKCVNGGLNGLEDRRRLLTRAKALMGV